MDVSRELVEAAKAGDQAALEDLISRSYRQAYSLAYRLMGNSDDAAEATQEAFIRMIRALKRLEDPGAYATWLFRTVQNVCLTELRRRSRREVPMEMTTLEDRETVDGEDVAATRVFRAELESCLARLPDTYRTVLVLRDVYDMSGEEAGKALGISAGAVKVRLHRARRRLRDELVSRFPDWGQGAKESREGPEGRAGAGGAEKS